MNEYLQNFTSYTNGSYGKILINKNKNQIIKQLELKSINLQDDDKNRDGLCAEIQTDTVMNEDKENLNGFAIREAIFLTLLKNIEGCPKIINIYVEDNVSMNILMPYYGITLNKWILTKQYTHANCLHIILTLVETFIYLLSYGIQHTDIKPTNILITNINTAVLIDFNLCSIIVSQSLCKNDFHWSKSICTWVYSCPEICEYEAPHDNSTSWSVGFIMVYLFTRGCHPQLIDNNTNDIIKYNDQHKWLEYIKNLKKISNKSFPVHLKLLKYIPLEVYNLYLKCCKWNPCDRIKLHDLYIKLTRYPKETLVFNLLPYTNISDITFIPSQCEIREKDIRKIYSILSNCEILNILFRTITLYDLCIEKCPDINTTEILIGVISIAYIICYEDLSESILLQLLLSHYESIYTENDIYTIIIEIGKKINWECYYLCDCFVNDTTREKHKILMDIFINTKDAYKISDILILYKNSI